jgi:hypothetical protein
VIDHDPKSGLPIFRPDGEVLRAFMRDNVSRVKIIQGPVGSGTSSACCLHAYQMGMAQPKQRDGKQRFRVHIFRETYPKIEETTLKTWLDWFPPKLFGRFWETKPYLHEIRVGPLELDVTFMAMEDIRDAQSYFKSLETSLIWFNEGQFTSFEVIRAAVERVSPPRYPAVKDGGCVWGGLILDTNAPPADHWIPIMRGDNPPPDWMTEEQRQSLKKPPLWKFYLQPPGLVEKFEGKTLVGYEPNPKAENTKYLPPNFYMEKIGGQTKSWIDANIMNRSSVLTDGKPVYPDFRRDVHVADKPLEVIHTLPVLVGLDFGRQPAAICCQNLRGRWLVYREIIGRDIAAINFAPIVRSVLLQCFPDHSLDEPGVACGFQFWGDPSGAFGGQASDETPFKVFRNHGMNVRPAPGNNRRVKGNDVLRTEGVNAVLTRMIEGKPALLVDPGCIVFITGMSGGFHYRRVQVSGDRYHDQPDKNQYSHVCEAFEYDVLGGGEGRSVMNPGQVRAAITNTRRPYNPYEQRVVRR